MKKARIKATKSQLKKLKKEKAIQFELALLLPAFSYVYEQHKEAEEDEHSGDDKMFMELASKIIKRVSIKIEEHRYLNEKTLPIINETFNELDTKNISIILIGVYLLLQHFYFEDKLIFIGLKYDIVDMEDYISRNIDKDEKVDKAMNLVEEYASNVYQKIHKKRYSKGFSI